MYVYRREVRIDDSDIQDLSVESVDTLVYKTKTCKIYNRCWFSIRTILDHNPRCCF